MSLGLSFKSRAVQSTTIKSFPRPCIFVKGIFMKVFQFSPAVYIHFGKDRTQFLSRGLDKPQIH